MVIADVGKVCILTGTNDVANTAKYNRAIGLTPETDYAKYLQSKAKKLVDLIMRIKSVIRVEKQDAR